MNNGFPLFCWTFDRTCPQPDTHIRLSELIDSPKDVIRVENKFGTQLRRELRRLGRPPLRKLRRLHKRPSIECKILTFM